MANSIARHSSQPPEDWDHPESTTSNTAAPIPSRVVFPSQGGCSAGDPPAPDAPDAPSLTPRSGRSGKRTLSELLKLHAEKGTDVHFTAEEATRLEELLGQWVCSCSLPINVIHCPDQTCFSSFALASRRVCVAYCIDNRSTRARRRMKAKTNFSHGHRMTRPCLSIARPPSTVSLDTHHTVRAKVLLSNHDSPFHVLRLLFLSCVPRLFRLLRTSVSACPLLSKSPIYEI